MKAYDRSIEERRFERKHGNHARCHLSWSWLKRQARRQARRQAKREIAE